MDVFPIPGGAGRGGLSSGVNWGIRPLPDSDGKYGRLQAINLETRKTAWVTRDRAPMTSGVLATAGGVVFAGAFDRVFRAYDDATGKVLWQTRLNDVSSSTPITFSVGGKQYIAVTTGQGGFHASSYAVLVPEFVSPPDRGAMLWVFGLAVETGNREAGQEAGSRKQEAGSRRQEAGGRKQEAGGRKQEAGGRRQEAGHRKPATGPSGIRAGRRRVLEHLERRLRVAGPLPRRAGAESCAQAARHQLPSLRAQPHRFDDLVALQHEIRGHMERPEACRIVPSRAAEPWSR